MDDLERLQHQARTGDAAAFTKLAGHYYPAFCRHASYLVRDADVAEDIVQEALLKAHLKIRTYDPQRSFSTWAYRIVTNCALDYLRKRKDQSLDDLEEVPAEEENQLLEQEDAAVHQQQIAALRKAIGNLPPHYQAVVNLYYWEQKSYDEIAAIMHKPLGTIKVWLYRAKRQLKEACNG
jgi:RNA polymerase sigma-70 factor (ECF subfamily)